MRDHDSLCPVARETWCLWPGDKCDHCRSIRRARAETLQAARDAVATVREPYLHPQYDEAIDDALAAIDALFPSDQQKENHL